MPTRSNLQPGSGYNPSMQRLQLIIIIRELLAQSSTLVEPGLVDVSGLLAGQEIRGCKLTIDAQANILSLEKDHDADLAKVIIDTYEQAQLLFPTSAAFLRLRVSQE